MIHKSSIANNSNNNNEKKITLETKSKKAKITRKNVCWKYGIENTHKTTKKVLFRAKANDEKTYQMNGVK